MPDSQVIKDKPLVYSKNPDGTYDVFAVGEINDEGKRLAQQLSETLTRT